MQTNEGMFCMASINCLVDTKEVASLWDETAELIAAHTEGRF